MTLTPDEIGELLACINAAHWERVEITCGDTSLKVVKSGDGSPMTVFSGEPGSPLPEVVGSPGLGRTNQAPADSDPGIVPEMVEHGHVVKSPSVGVLWRAPEPGAEPFVQIGDTVSVGDTLCICEVMKLFAHVVAEVSGIVTAIHVSNGDYITYGEPLMTISDAGDGQ